MKLRLWIVLAVVLVALLAGLRWQRARSERETRQGGGNAPSVEPASPGAGAGPSSTTKTAPIPPPENPSKLHGLRLLAAETAAARGWKPRTRPRVESDPLRETRKLWATTRVDLLFNDESLEKVFLFFGEKYGLHLRIDSAVSLEGKTATFKVSGLGADQALDLLMKMADLGFAIDAAGVAWVTTRERAKMLAAPPEPQTDPWGQAASRIRSEASRKPEPAAPAPADPPWKSKRVTVSIVNKPIKEAVADLRKALGDPNMAIAVWSLEAHQKAGKALPVSVVAEDTPAGEVLDQILKGSGITLQIRQEGSALFVTEEQVEATRREEEAFRKAVANEQAEEAAFRRRRVTILGDLLSASDVAGQIASQLAVTLRMSEEVSECPAVWESDGLEQSVGEVLDILARDGELIWRWQGESDPASRLPQGARCLWIVGAKER